MYDLINSQSISFPKFIEIEGEEKPNNEIITKRLCEQIRKKWIKRN